MLKRGDDLSRMTRLLVSWISPPATVAPLHSINDANRRTAVEVRARASREERKREREGEGTQINLVQNGVDLVEVENEVELADRGEELVQQLVGCGRWGVASRLRVNDPRSNSVLIWG